MNIVLWIVSLWPVRAKVAERNFLKFENCNPPHVLKKMNTLNALAKNAHAINLRKAIHVLCDRLYWTHSVTRIHNAIFISATRPGRNAYNKRKSIKCTDTVNQRNAIHLLCYRRFWTQSVTRAYNRQKNYRNQHVALTQTLCWTPSTGVQVLKRRHFLVHFGAE